jgi:DNA-binding response OmpR family regulator
MKTETNPKVLVVSWNEMLRQTRRLILGTYFETESAGKMTEAAQLLLENHFGVIVLCDTLSDSECLQVADIARIRNPQAKIILLEGPNRDRPASISGGRVQCLDGPLSLLKECAQVLGVGIGNKGRATVV